MIGGMIYVHLHINYKQYDSVIVVSRCMCNNAFKKKFRFKLHSKNSSS